MPRAWQSAVLRSSRMLPGPVEGHQAAQVFRSQYRRRTVVAFGRLEQELVVEGRDVFAALTQRREFDADDVEAVIEIGAKPALIGK
jgi:hypothetical protein